MNDSSVSRNINEQGIGMSRSGRLIMIVIIVLAVAGAFCAALLVPLPYGAGILLFTVSAFLSLICAGFSGFSIRFPLLLGGADLLCLVFLFFFLPSGPDHDGGVSLLLLILPASGIIAGAFLSAFGIRLSAGMVANVRYETEGVKQNLVQTHESITKAQDVAREIGIGIFETVEKTVASIHRLEGLVSGTADGIQMLDQMLKDAAGSNEKIVETHTRVRQVLGSYSSEVEAESAAVSALANSVTRITESSHQRYEKAANLLELSEGAESKLKAIKQAINKIVSSAEKMNEMAAQITDVSSRTNLLAMNASIEAAHSGAAGKGFAVIAGQIRSLSVQAADASRAIAEVSSEVSSSITATVGAADGAIHFFHNVSEESRGIAGMLQELLSGMKEMSVSADGLLESVRRVDGLTTSTGEAMETSERSIDAAKSSLSTVVEIAGTIHSDASAMMRAFNEMLAEAERVRSLGLSNREHIEMLTAELKRKDTL